MNGGTAEFFGGPMDGELVKLSEFFPDFFVPYKLAYEVEAQAETVGIPEGNITRFYIYELTLKGEGYAQYRYSPKRSQ